MLKLLFLALLVNYAELINLAEFNPQYDDSDRVVGGSVVPKNTNTFVILFQGTELNDQPFCSGTLVKTNKVLTSASCGLKMRTLPTHAYLWNLVYPIREEVVSIVVHPTYDSKTNMDNLAVVTLENDFLTNEVIQPILIDYPINLSGITPYALGWGYNNPSVANDLRKADVSFNVMTVCSNYFQNPDLITSSIDKNMCLKANGVASCSVDDGGPIISQNDTLIGVNSVFDCKVGQPFVAVRLQLYQEWIQANI